MRIRADLNPKAKDLSKVKLNALRSKLKNINPLKLLDILGIDGGEESSETFTDSNEYNSERVNISAIQGGKLLSLKEYCENFGIDFKMVSSAKLVQHTGISYYNIVLHVINELDIQEIVKKSLLPIERIKTSPQIIDSNTVDRLIFTDVHIGMDNGGEWNESELFERLEKMIQYVKQNKQSNKLIIDDLGDFVDGYEKKTTRGGHELEQNLSSSEQVEIGVKFKSVLFNELCRIYESVTHNAVCNDNHAGSLAEILNTFVKNVNEERFSNLKVNVLKGFMSAYEENGFSFILSHGKDSKYMKAPFGLSMSKKTKDIILDFCIKKEIKVSKIIFSKGDLHQFLFDETDTIIEYNNYGAFSLPSNYCDSNYGASRSGFVFEVIENQTITRTPIFF